jgi:hypothetical protein
MRAFTIFLLLFSFVMLSTPPSSESSVGAEELTPRVENRLTQIDLGVLRLASDFSIMQSKIADMILYRDLSDRTKNQLIVDEKTLRDAVISVVGAARIRDHDTVRALMPSVARQVRQQILILIEADSVARQWAAARNKTQEMAQEMAKSNTRPGSARLLSALTEIGIGD